MNVQSEIFTGAMLKQWFINAYIDLENNKDIFFLLVENNQDIEDINNIIYMYKIVVEELEKTIDDNNCITVLQNVISIMQNLAITNGALTIFKCFVMLLEEIKQSLTPIEIIELINKIGSKITNENSEENQILLNNIFYNAIENCKYLENIIDLKSVCQSFIVSSQLVFAEMPEEKMRYSYKYAIACTVISSLEYALEESDGASLAVRNMLVDTAEKHKKNKNKIRSATENYEIFYTIEANSEIIKYLEKKYDEKECKYIIVGKSDNFFVTKWYVNVKGNELYSMIPKENKIKNLIIKNLSPISMHNYTNISDYQNDKNIAIFEKNNTNKELNLSVIACLENLSLSQMITRTGAQVVYKMEENTILKTLFEIMNKNNLVYIYSKKIIKTENEQKILENNEYKKIIFVKTLNDLETKTLSENIASNMVLIKEKQELHQNIFECIKTLSNYRVLNINENMDVEEKVQDFIAPNDKYITILLSEKNSNIWKEKIENIIARITNNEAYVETFLEKKFGQSVENNENIILLTKNDMQL